MKKPVIVLAAAAIAAGSFLAGQAFADYQPKMRGALNNLHDAERDLQQADDDKSGHRRKALRLVRGAIEQVERGIAADNRR